MSKKQSESFQVESFRAMGMDVGRLIPFLKDTACMNPSERKVVAILDGFKDLFGDNPRFDTFLKWTQDKARPFFIKLGQANWKRDVLTDLGLAKAHQAQRISDLQRVLTFQPSKKE